MLYKLWQCNSGYIGEIVDLKRRMYQHEYAKQNLKITKNNALVKHLFDKEHNINIKHHNVVANISDTNKIKLIENTLINNININSCNLNFDKFINEIMKTIP